MNVPEVFRIAVSSLLLHKTRALLTILGIVIGVGAVVAMIAVGQGAQTAVQNQIASLGTNVLMVFPGASNQGGVSGGAGTAAALSEEDVTAIRELAPAVSAVTPNVRTNRQVIAGNLNWNTVIQGGNTDFFTIRDWQLENGDIFSEADVRSGNKVAVIGRTVAENLFGSEDPVGKSIRIQKMPFKVVGTLSPKGQNAGGQDQDDLIIAPFSTVQKKVMGTDRINSILMSASSESMIPEAQQQVTEILRQRHRLAEWQENDFTIRSQTEIASAATATTNIMTMLLGSIASVSLLVGGIGIMNIMLVSVTERTREIGIRRSLGARRRDILRQFLLESILLSFLGGLAGIGIGLLISRLVSRFAGWPVLVSIESVVLAFLFSTAIGVFFGFYPARKASMLNPIEALRYE